MSTEIKPRRPPPDPHSPEALRDYKRDLLSDALTSYEDGTLRAGSSEQIERMHSEARKLGARARKVSR